MSLKVWLPLNEDLRNQGASSLGAVSAPASAIVANDGKIGKCYTNSGANAGTSNDFNFSASQFSMAAWVRINTRVNSWRCAFKLANSAGDKDYIGFCCEHNTTTTLIGFHFYKTISGTNTAIFDHYPTSINAAVGTWTHLAVTYDGKEVKYYQDGVCKQTSAIAAAKQNTIANTNKLIMFGSDGSRSTAAVKHSLNDVRIYDHCLSAAEVHEISQGLVLHYKLSDILNPNLLPATVQNIDAWTASGSTKTADSGAIKFQPSGGELRIYISTSNLWTTSGGKYTVSLDAKADANGRALRASRSIADYAPNFTLTTDWQHYTGIITLTGTSTAGTLSLQGPSGSTIWVRNVKVEKGEIATPFNLAGETIIVQDSSGYGHNGTIAGNILLSSNTARYSASSLFNGTERIDAETLGADIRTLSCWCKTTKNKSTSQHMVADSFSNMCISFYNGTIIGVFGTTRSTGSKSTLGTSYKENDWNHIVVVKTDDAGARDIYCNGVKLTPTSNDYWSAATGFFIGARNNTNGNAFYGNISDVRAYCTALSAADVKQLYEVGAKVDNLGNLHTYEFNERGPNKIYKTGITQGQEISEINGMSNLKYDPNVYIEPDGSTWVRIFHHNNPTSYKFVSSDTFTTGVYKDENRWFNFDLCNYVDKWEFIVKSKTTPDATEYKYRWIQTKNPLTAVFADVSAANVIKTTTGGYSSYSWGGLYKINSNTFLCTNNGTSGNWWGAVGAWNAHQGGIPGWVSVITTGYEDVYLRIDNITTTSPLIAKSTKNNLWIGHNLIEL